jgi:hypothetical protein
VAERALPALSTSQIRLKRDGRRGYIWQGIVTVTPAASVRGATTMWDVKVARPLRRQGEIVASAAVVRAWEVETLKDARALIGTTEVRNLVAVLRTDQVRAV